MGLSGADRMVNGNEGVEGSEEYDPANPFQLDEWLLTTGRVRSTRIHAQGSLSLQGSLVQQLMLSLFSVSVLSDVVPLDVSSVVSDQGEGSVEMTQGLEKLAEETAQQRQYEERLKDHEEVLLAEAMWADSGGNSTRQSAQVEVAEIRQDGSVLKGTRVRLTGLQKQQQYNGVVRVVDHVQQWLEGDECEQRFVRMVVNIQYNGEEK